MRRLLKTLYLENGELYATIGGNRILFANCEPKVEIYEDIHNIKTIGINGYKVKTRKFTIVLCNEIEFSRNVDVELLNRITEFNLLADIQRKDGVFERLTFDNLIPDELDLNGEWSFEVSQYSDITRKLLNI